MIRALLATALVAAAAPGPAVAQAPPTARQLIDARVAGMHMAATLFYRGVKGALANGADVRQIFHEPEGLALWANAIPGLFPAGSGGEGSRARPEIWTRRADFERKAADLGVAATRVAERARAGDRAGFAAAADAVEAACTACHSAYRSE
ncbi:MAG TPA: cytochrome c [Allosphingosinicella sp.]|nr:cytochrome c [Allosphingosinicella sp.]